MSVSLNKSNAKISIVIPAKNEAQSLKILLPGILGQLPDSEIIVVNDGSTDDTEEVCRQFGVIELRHHYSMGNGAAIKAGARYASGHVIVFMDGDGQHSPNDIVKLLDEIDKGYDLVVGARTSDSQASWGRGVANRFYNKLASYMTGNRIRDLTSGFRACRANKFREFLSLLPNGFSYPTTSTMAFFRAGYSVSYVTIEVGKRVGKSHINILRDGLRFLLIIFKIGTLYSPLKLFVPLAFLLFLLGLGYYGYTYSTVGRFTNMSGLLFSTSVLIFLMGLVSEQITQLMYKDTGTSIDDPELIELARQKRSSDEDPR